MATSNYSTDYGDRHWALDDVSGGADNRSQGPGGNVGGGEMGGTGGGRDPATPWGSQTPPALDPLAGSMAANYATQGGNGGGWTNFASYLGANPLHAGTNKIAGGKSDSKTGAQSWGNKYDQATADAYGISANRGASSSGPAPGIGIEGGGGGPGSGAPDNPVQQGGGYNPDTQPVFQLMPPSSITFGTKGRW